MKPSISLMPRSVYWPLVHMSHSPTAQFGQGTGSGRRTMPTTRSRRQASHPHVGGPTHLRPACWKNVRQHRRPTIGNVAVDSPLLPDAGLR